MWRLCIALALTTTSCATTYRVPSGQLSVIVRAFETRETVEMEADEGYGLEPIEVDDSDHFRFRNASGDLLFDGTLESLGYVSEGVLELQPESELGVSIHRGALARGGTVPSTEIQSIEIWRRSKIAIVGFVIGALAVGAAAACAIALGQAL
jgi:hypothetical protein